MRMKPMSVGLGMLERNYLESQQVRHKRYAFTAAGEMAEVKGELKGRQRGVRRRLPPSRVVSGKLPSIGPPCDLKFTLPPPQPPLPPGLGFDKGHCAVLRGSG